MPSLRALNRATLDRQLLLRRGRLLAFTSPDAGVHGLVFTPAGAPGTHRTSLRYRAPAASQVSRCSSYSTPPCSVPGDGSSKQDLVRCTGYANSRVSQDCHARSASAWSTSAKT